MNSFWFLVHKYNKDMRIGVSCFVAPLLQQRVAKDNAFIPKFETQRIKSTSISSVREGLPYLSQFKLGKQQPLKNLLISSEDLPVVSGKKKRETIEKNKEVKP